MDLFYRRKWFERLAKLLLLALVFSMLSAGCGKRPGKQSWRTMANLLIKKAGSCRIYRRDTD